MNDLEKAMVDAAANALHQEMKGQKYSARVTKIDTKNLRIETVVSTAATGCTITAGIWSAKK